MLRGCGMKRRGVFSARGLGKVPLLLRFGGVMLLGIDELTPARPIADDIVHSIT